MLARFSVLSVSVFALVACESHSSAANKAPVVNGNDPARQARVYNSPNQQYRRQQTVQRNSQRPARTANVEPVELQPVSAIYLDEPRELEPVEISSRSAKQAPEGDVIVRPGDTVYAIARRYEVAPKEIIAVNRLRHPYTLSVGQTLKLPKGARIAGKQTPARKVVAQDTLYKVRPGDTLYSISRNSGSAVSTIAQANNLLPPYGLTPGQQILIPQARLDSNLYAANTAPQQKSKPAAKSKPTRQAQASAPTQAQSVAELTRKASYTPPKETSPASMFEWPVQGKVIANYGAADLGRRNDGVNIAAPAGTPVRAAAEGEVVYRGSELDGFGNLLLVKHDGGFVTAYAHNDAMLVKKGDKVRQGQVIAKVGDTGAVTSPQLHFEIRQNLKSVDPTALLGPK